MVNVGNIGFRFSLINVLSPASVQKLQPTVLLTPNSFFWELTGGRLSKVSQRLNFRYKSCANFTERLEFKLDRTRPQSDMLGYTSRVVLKSARSKLNHEIEPAKSTSALFCCGVSPESGLYISLVYTAPASQASCGAIRANHVAPKSAAHRRAQVQVLLAAGEETEYVAYK